MTKMWCDHCDTTHRVRAFKWGNGIVRICRICAQNIVDIQLELRGWIE